MSSTSLNAERHTGTRHGYCIEQRPARWSYAPLFGPARVKRRLDAGLEIEERIEVQCGMDLYQAQLTIQRIPGAQVIRRGQQGLQQVIRPLRTRVLNDGNFELDIFRFA